MQRQKTASLVTKKFPLRGIAQSYPSDITKSNIQSSVWLPAKFCCHSLSLPILTFKPTKTPDKAQPAPAEHSAQRAATSNAYQRCAYSPAGAI